ncbi:RAMP superfamily CRISPR-associated protein [uncultured Actinomyces sp.]|uniref:RAMP superfamily CRISPR-associated protein n=1 Tax=uncultured Actinomyces sp. TaxID=249061 RepID=UPI00288B5A44|nr:RAMP superfamily CRISPR-associated protein [uncultured Actinomyces sp.]
MSVIRYELTIRLKTASPLHSGGIDEVVNRLEEGKDRQTVVRRFARDGNDRPILTGRSVKGALRAACRRHLEERPNDAVAKVLTSEALRRLWGDEGKKSASAPLRAACLTVHTVPLIPEADDAGGADGTLPSRMGNAIDRYWGSVADGALFEHEYLPAGKPLTLVITAQAGLPDGVAVPAGAVEPATPEQVETLFELLLGLFRSERISFGGRRGAGWGRVRPDVQPDADFWTLTRAPLGSCDDLVSWLSGGQDMAGAITPVDCGGPDRMRITIAWNSPTGILVADPRLSEAELERKKQEKEKREKAAQKADQGGGQGDVRDDYVPAMQMCTDTAEGKRLVLPGSSVRGALRSRASRIARTILAARHAPVADWSNTGVHDQLAADPVLVRDLFGSTEQRGALTVLDTLAVPRRKPRNIPHNAGDRWTGGVAGGALYGEEVHDAQWGDLTLELDPNSFSPQADVNRRKAAWCLLGLVLAELAAGTLPLGSRGTRGLGQVRVTGIRIEGGSSLGVEDWSAPEKGGGGSSEKPLAAQILHRLRAVNEDIAASPDAGDNWTGYLLPEGGAR